MQYINLIWLAVLIVYYVLSTLTVTSEAAGYYCYTCSGQKSNRKCMSSYTQCDENQACFCSYGRKGTGHIYGLVKRCIDRCPFPGRPLRGKTQYCCLGNFCNQQMFFFPPDGINPRFPTPIITTTTAVAEKDQKNILTVLCDLVDLPDPIDKVIETVKEVCALGPTFWQKIPDPFNQIKGLVDKLCDLLGIPDSIDTILEILKKLCELLAIFLPEDPKPSITTPLPGVSKVTVSTQVETTTVAEKDPKNILKKLCDLVDLPDPIDKIVELVKEICDLGPDFWKNIPDPLNQIQNLVDELCDLLGIPDSIDAILEILKKLCELLAIFLPDDPTPNMITTTSPGESKVTVSTQVKTTDVAEKDPKNILKSLCDLLDLPDPFDKIVELVKEICDLGPTFWQKIPDPLNQIKNAVDELCELLGIPDSIDKIIEILKKLCDLLSIFLG